MFNRSYSKHSGMNRIILPALASICILAVLLAGCTGAGKPGPSGTEETPTPQPSPGQQSSPLDTVIDTNNAFAIDLYRQLKRDPEYRDSNIFFSPFSISTALAITYEGAREQTADQIRSVFHFPDNKSVLQHGTSDLIARINDQANVYTLRTANALWAEQSHPFLPDYISTAGRYYSAKTTNLDFVHHPEESRITINQWVEDQTEDRIKDVIPRGAIDSNTTLVITNAIYFKGTWVKQFEPALTRDADFLSGNGDTVRVPMMQRTDDAAVFRYAETDSLQVLEMPYESGDGTELSMLVLLPKDGSLDTIEKSMDAGMIQEIRKSFAYKIVRVYFPKFTMETKYFLPRTLTAMGMPTAFTADADFSGMDGSRDLFITDVIHQAFVDVNEEGTEAAAATAVIVGRGAAPLEETIPVFRADHPFMFLIQDNETGNILFMGRVINPVGK